MCIRTPPHPTLPTLPNPNHLHNFHRFNRRYHEGCSPPRHSALLQNFHRFSGANTLAALVSGASARAAEDAPPEELRDAALAVLRRIHPGVDVPEPVAFTVSKWASGAALVRYTASFGDRLLSWSRLHACMLPSEQGAVLRSLPHSTGWRTVTCLPPPTLQSPSPEAHTRLWQWVPLASSTMSWRGR